MIRHHGVRAAVAAIEHAFKGGELLDLTERVAAPERKDREP